MIAKKYVIFCLLLITSMTVANYRGIIYSNYFAKENIQANKAANNFHK